LICFDPQAAALINDDGMDGADDGSARLEKTGQVLVRRRAGLGRCLCSPLARPFVCECHKISTMPEPGRTESPVISVVEVGYVKEV
jgi:hypothetical protein